MSKLKFQLSMYNPWSIWFKMPIRSTELMSRCQFSSCALHQTSELKHNLNSQMNCSILIVLNISMEKYTFISLFLYDGLRLSFLTLCVASFTFVLYLPWKKKVWSNFSVSRGYASIIHFIYGCFGFVLTLKHRCTGVYPALKFMGLVCHCSVLVQEDCLSGHGGFQLTETTCLQWAECLISK